MKTYYRITYYIIFAFIKLKPKKINKYLSCRSVNPFVQRGVGCVFECDVTQMSAHFQEFGRWKSRKTIP